ncbi:MAG: hypothetical protein R6W86_17205 [Marinobacter sp.]
METGSTLNPERRAAMIESGAVTMTCPDERLGERLCAFVTLDENATDLTLDQAKAYLAEQQLARNYLAEYQTYVHAARIQCYHALGLKDNNLPHNAEAAMNSW